MNKIALKSGYYFLPVEKEIIPFFDKLKNTQKQVLFDKEKLDVYDAFDVNTSREVDDFFGNRMGFDMDEYLVEDCQEDLTI